MKKIIYYKTKDCGYQVFYNSVSEHHSILNFLFSSFNQQHHWIYFELGEDCFFICNEFIDEECELRGISRPKLKISKENYKAVAHQWNDNIDNGLAPYLVLWQDEKTGWISLDAKQELSSEDLLHIAEENKKERARLHEHCKRGD